ncbi:hypothetical protein SRHO_G00124410 [Serrasalmus rhombeus]
MTRKHRVFRRFVTGLDPSLQLDRLAQQVAEFPWGLQDCAHPVLLPCSANTHGCPVRHPEQESLHHCSCVDRCVTSSHAPTRGRQPLRDDISPPRHRSPSAGKTGHPADLRYTFDDDSSAHLRRPRHPLPCHFDTHRQCSGYWEDFSPPRRRHDSSYPYDYGHTDLTHHAIDTVTFLGHQVSSAGVRPDPSNTEKVASWPVPHSATEDPTGRRARWAVELDLHDWTVVYRDGTKHLNADSMSRCPHNTSSDIHSPSMSEKPPMATTATQTAPEHSRQKYFQVPGCHLQGTDSYHTSTNLVHIQADWDLPTKQRNDPYIAKVFGWLERDWCPPLWKLGTSSPFLRKLWSQFPGLRICNGLLCRHVCCSSPNGHLGQVVVPRLLVPEVLYFLHGHPAAGHYGVAKTLDRALRSFYWPYMSSDISQYCRQCAACHSRRSLVPSSQGPLVSISLSRPFQIVAADITELPVSPIGNHYVLVLMDLYTKFVNLYPLQTQTAISVTSLNNTSLSMVSLKLCTQIRDGNLNLTS